MEIQIRITPKILRAVAKIERLSGKWERLSLSIQDGWQEEEARKVASQNALAALALDFTAPPGISTALLNFHSTTLPHSAMPSPLHSLSNDESFVAFCRAERSSFALSFEGIRDLFTELTGRSGDVFRKAPENFHSPAPELGKEEILFATTAPFLVAQRLEELLEWAQKELEEEGLHPLLVTALFHLSFLQISPFSTANHRLAFLLDLHLLKDHGYTFVRHENALPYFAERSKAYFNSLRQAEKTAGTTWATCTMWLELFLAGIGECAAGAVERLEGRAEKQRLTNVQKKIVEVVKLRGPVTRDTIADSTGINESTVKYNLGVLSSRGILNRLGGGRTTSYTVAN